MEGPSEEFRMHIRERMDEISDYGSEEGLEELLAEIEQQLIEDLQRPAPTDPTPLISAMMSWASLASYAVGRFYGPASLGRETLPAGYESSRSASGHNQRVITAAAAGC
jgi:hypothetical protein